MVGSDRYVALLRGINLGGKNRLAMADLARILAAEGCRDVATYIQSGNAAFAADPNAVADLPGRLAARIAADTGLRVPVVLRSADQMTAVVAGNPFHAAGAAEDALHVMFLADRPDPARAATLDPDRSPPDAFALVGSEVYLHYPAGLARSKLTNAYFDAKLATVSTIRNWRTVLKLAALVAG